MNESTLKQTLGYIKFNNSPNVLVLDTGYLVVNDIIDGAVDAGWTVSNIKSKAKGSGDGDFIKRLLYALVDNKPDFIITVNHLGFDDKGILSNLLMEYDIPVASWFVDHPMPILGGAKNAATDNTQIFCFERTALGWLKDRGFKEPSYLPTGTNIKYFNTGYIDTLLVKKLAHPLTFAGNSWWIKAVGEPKPVIKKSADMLMRKIAVNHNSMADGFSARFKKIRLKVAKDRDRYSALQVALAKASMNTRSRFAKALAPLGLRIHGDEHWRQFVSGLSVVPFVDYKKGLPALFLASHVNANVTAEQMPTAVNQRVWDVPACGGFLLTDYREDAVDAFKENEQIVVYKSFEEARDKAAYYLKNREFAKKIAKEAHDEVHRHHKISDRLTVMYSVMKKRFS